MPFIPNTPESLIGRSDSKNPSTTCRGITSGGRPCRRPLAATPGSSPAASPFASPNRRNQLRVDDPSDPELYCWQHKQQASSSAKSSPGPSSRTKLSPVRQESFESLESLESLIGRLGIVEAERNGRKQQGKPPKPPNGRRNEKISQTRHANAPQPPRPQRKAKAQKQVSFCFCFTVPVYEEEEPPPRPQPRPIQNLPTKPNTAKLPSNQHLTPSYPSQRPSLAASKQSSAQSAMSQTSDYLSLIPKSVLPETAANLLKELSKPISQTDEAGYIYIFWLTPESQPATPPAEAARNLLAPPSRPDMHHRRTSDVLQSFAAQSTRAGSSSKTMLLKIGRASNVQRRLNEWQRQCGYNLSLIRYYPYVSSSRPSTPRKMPHSHKVERLIHIELEGRGLRVNHKTSCDACGKNHREWFEVEASRAGVNAVDEIVRRWSDWDEGNPQRF
ncbi:meiotically up-regulated gene 113-domain-containing protein [Hypoxylon argillaceum]|nr:meiotically up-regulated gene 113-domain-containing protein [Hypoxylon argillaceum]